MLFKSYLKYYFLEKLAGEVIPFETREELEERRKQLRKERNGRTPFQSILRSSGDTTG